MNSTNNQAGGISTSSTINQIRKYVRENYQFTPTQREMVVRELYRKWCDKANQSICGFSLLVFLDRVRLLAENGIIA